MPDEADVVCSRQSPTAIVGVPTTQGQPPGPGMAQAIRRPLSLSLGACRPGWRWHTSPWRRQSQLRFGTVHPTASMCLPSQHAHPRSGEPELTKGRVGPLTTEKEQVGGRREGTDGPDPRHRAVRPGPRAVSHRAARTPRKEVTGTPGPGHGQAWWAIQGPVNRHREKVAAPRLGSHRE